MIHKLTIDYITPLETQLKELGIENYLDLAKITCLFPHTKTIHNIEDGTATMGKSPENCEKEFVTQKRRGLCIHEGLALLRKNKKLLQHHYIDLVGSRYENRGRVPNVFLDCGVQPKLGGGCADSADEHWGSPSCDSSELGNSELENRVLVLEEKMRKIEKFLII